MRWTQWLACVCVGTWIAGCGTDAPPETAKAPTPTAGASAPVEANEVSGRPMADSDSNGVPDGTIAPHAEALNVVQGGVVSNASGRTAATYDETYSRAHRRDEAKSLSAKGAPVDGRPGEAKPGLAAAPASTPAPGFIPAGPPANLPAPAADPAAAAPARREAEADYAAESYAAVTENDYLRAKDNPLSTFSIDVDTASYANVRRFLNGYQLPPAAAVRLEELVNYFTYNYGPPTGDVPFAVHVEAAQCPWNTKHHLVRIALKGRIIEKEQRPVSNLVFLIDVSGSMAQPNKLPLVKESLKLLVNELTENDRVAICVYAGAAGLVLPSTTGDQKQIILSSLDNLQAGGSTAGGAGIELAYKTAVENLIEKGTNRVILCTDGDFNVGVQDQAGLHELITDKAKSGVFLSVMGFGMGNYKDTTMELLADKGNGNYAYIDTLNEGRKVFVEQMTGTLITIAKDVKIQVDFNPKHVAAYRLLGYENRLLKAEDFKDDKKDAGEIGAGHTVTALYEIVPPGVAVPAGDVEPSKYQKTEDAAEAENPGAHADEMLTVRLRYKDPDGETSKPLEVPLKAEVGEFDQTTTDFQFATSVVQFGMLLRHSKHKGGANWDSVIEIAQGSLGADESGYRAEFLELAKRARELSKK